MSNPIYKNRSNKEDIVTYNNPDRCQPYTTLKSRGKARVGVRNGQSQGKARVIYPDVTLVLGHFATPTSGGSESGFSQGIEPRLLLEG